jgi:DNA replication and repair protein RecF
VSLPDGVTVVHGAIAAGKTNFLEAAYFGCLGSSCRTANEYELVKFGERATTVSILIMNGSDEHTLEIGFEPGRPKVLKRDGVRMEHLFGWGDRPLPRAARCSMTC